MAKSCGDDYSDLLLPFVELSDGRMVSVSEVARGLSCNCKCPSCGVRLVARQGESGKQRWNFAHESEHSCVGGLETSVHKMAKQIIHDEMRVYLPDVAAKYQDQTKVEYTARWGRFDAVALEVWQSGIRADIVARRGDRQLLIEILFSHACGPEKITSIRERGAAAIEIDLKDCRNGEISPERLRQLVLADAPRRWLFHPHQDRIDAVLRDEVVAAEEAEQLRISKLSPSGRMLHEMNRTLEQVMQDSAKRTIELNKLIAARRARHRNFNAKLQRLIDEMSQRAGTK